MASVINNDYEKILDSYTKIFEFSRYDRLSYDLQNKKIADIASDEHKVNNDYYRNYGTYRHDIIAEDYIVKENETYLDDNELTDNYYDYNEFVNFKSDNNEVYNVMQFAGCVLNPAFATNAHEASLEDIFVEYCYDYLKALNDSYKVTEDYKGLYYFDTDSEINSYEIKPIGYEYINYDRERKDESVEDRYEKVEYDGTYVPTVQELLSGNLYIVISSGNLDYCRKIYFNNTYMPTLFINDDKLKAKQNQYVIDEQQPMKLCDITLYQKLGCIIKWKSIFKIQLFDGVKDNAFEIMLKNVINKVYELKLSNPNNINLEQYADKIYLTPFYKVELKIVKGSPLSDNESVHDIGSTSPVTYGNEQEGVSEKIIDVVTGSFTNNFIGSNIQIIDTNGKLKQSITDDINITNITTENINNTYIEGIENPKIQLHIQATYALAFNGYKNKVDDKPKYSLYWYKIVED